LRDAEIGVPELALDDRQRDALTCHLDRVRMAKLMRCEAPPHARADSEGAQGASGGQHARAGR
jgi:hypothetical protein